MNEFLKSLPFHSSHLLRGFLNPVWFLYNRRM